MCACEFNPVQHIPHFIIYINLIKLCIILQLLFLLNIHKWNSYSEYIKNSYNLLKKKTLNRKTSKVYGKKSFKAHYTQIRIWIINTGEIFFSELLAVKGNPKQKWYNLPFIKMTEITKSSNATSWQECLERNRYPQMLLAEE